MTTNHGLCYCEAPFIGHPLPEFMRDRAHIRRANCGTTRLVQSPWMARRAANQLPAKVFGLGR